MRKGKKAEEIRDLGFNRDEGRKTVKNQELRTEVKQRKLDLWERTKNFVLGVVRLFTKLPKTTEARILGRQLLRCGTSVGANYREAYQG